MTIFRFGELGELFDGPHATPQRTESGPYFLNIASLVDGRLDLSLSDHVSEAQFAQWTRRVTPQPGDLLFSYETRLGDAALMPDKVRACLGRRMALLRPNRNVVDPQFLLYYYMSPIMKDTIERNTIHGATVNRISLSTMGEWPIIVPDLADQHAVAAVLGALDSKIAANDITVRTAREICRSLFQQEVGQGEVARRSVRTIDELMRAGALVVSDGYRTKRSELNQSGYRIIRVADVSASEVSLLGADFVSEEYAGAIGGKAGKRGDILLTTKGTVGRLAVVREIDERIVYSPQLCYFRVNENELIDRWYLRYWFESAEFLQQASHRMNNSDMAPYISLADIRSLRVTLPPIEGQRKLSRALDALESEVGALQQESRTLAATRDLLLPHLMSGKLRVKDAEKQVEAVV